MQYDLEKIGRTIRGERKKHTGWTQKKFGAMLGVTGTQVSNYENGKQIPPQDILLKMAKLFDCEYRHLLGEESYKDMASSNTAVCEFLGLSSQAVAALRGATHKGLQGRLAKRQQAINKFFESEYFGQFIDCLVEAIDIGQELDSFCDVLYRGLIVRYGEKMVNQTMIYSAFGGTVSAANSKDPRFQEVAKEIEAIMEKGRASECAQKIARYELRESFEQLIRSIQ